MSVFGYEYFCGANVVVKVEGQPLLEAVGLRCELNDSKKPVYGYSSRHFDGVSAGQVIVQGTVLVNYIHQDYLFRAVQRGLGIPFNNTVNTGPLIPSSQEDFQALLADYPEAVAFAEQMKSRFWNTDSPSGSRGAIQNSFNPNDFMGGIDITVSFGEQNDNRPNGVTGMLIRDVHFQSRGIAIEVDENTIVEAYSFFARNLFSTRNPNLETVNRDLDEDFQAVNQISSE